MTIVTGLAAQRANAQRNTEIIARVGKTFAELFVSDTNVFFRKGLGEAFSALVRCLGDLSNTFDTIPIVTRLLEEIYQQRPSNNTEMGSIGILSQKERNRENELRGYASIYAHFLDVAEECRYKEERSRDETRETAWYA